MAEPTPQEVSRLIAAKDRATRDSEYVETLNFEAQQTEWVKGTRYIIKLTDADNR